MTDQRETFAPVASRLAMAGVTWPIPVSLSAFTGAAFTALGVPEIGVALVAVIAVVWLRACWRLALSLEGDRLVVRNLWSTRRVTRGDVRRVGVVDGLPWYWLAPFPLAPMVELRLHDGEVLRLQATLLPGRDRRRRAAAFVGPALKMSQHRLRDYVDGDR